jgi:LPXTG-motif cell wall-anchored protein
MTIAMSIGAHNLSAVPIIILALIIVGAAIYFIRQRRKNPSNGHDI